MPRIHPKKAKRPHIRIACDLKSKRCKWLVVRRMPLNLLCALFWLVLLSQILRELKPVWDELGSAAGITLAQGETSFDSKGIIKEKLVTYGMEGIAEKIAHERSPSSPANGNRAASSKAALRLPL